MTGKFLTDSTELLKKQKKILSILTWNTNHHDKHISS